MQTHEWAPRVLLANSNLVGDWANWEEFRRLEALGLTMYGQMTAGSWIYIGTQGILQGTYETFAAVAAKKFRRHDPGRDDHPDRRPRRHGRRAAAGRHHERRRGDLHRLRRALHRPPRRAPLPGREGELAWTTRSSSPPRPATSAQPLSIGVLGNAAELVPQLLAMDAPIDIVTDQTSAHDPLAYLPLGVDFHDMKQYAADKPAEFTQRARESMAKHVEAMVGFQDKGAEVFDYGNSIRGEAQLAGYDAGLRLPRLRPGLHPPAVLRGQGPVPLGRAVRRGAATSPRPTRRSWTCSRRTSRWHRWIKMAGERVHFQGLPARICWLGYGERDQAGERFNDMVADGELAAPIVDRPRPPGLRLGGLAVPGDRGDGRRLRRDRRLAAAERDGQRGLRRVVGVDPPRRRRRHGPLDPRRAGDRRRRHEAGRARRSAGC